MGAKNGGLEPGTLRGGRGDAMKPADPDQEMHDLVRGMSGEQMLKWLKQGDNRQKYNDALAKRTK